ncbi:MAG: hypothetical protein V4773_30025 [Verrucomicrobiota bacterium]
MEALWAAFERGGRGECGEYDAEQLGVLAERMLVLEGRLSPAARSEIETISGGRSLAELAGKLREAVSAEAIQAAAAMLAANESGCACSGVEPPEPTPAQSAAATERLVEEAIAPWVRNARLRAVVIEGLRKSEV